MNRRSCVWVTLFVLVMAFASLATSAFAVSFPGGSIADASYLNDYFKSHDTTSLVGNTGLPGTGQYFYKTLLGAGDTLNATFTPDSSVLGLKASVLVPAKSSVTPSGSPLAKLTFVAPAAGMYNIWVTASSLGTFTVTPTVVHPVSFTMSALTAPKRIKHTKSFTTYVLVKPAYKSTTSPIKFEFQRHTNSGWHAYGALVKTAFSTKTSTSTRFKYTTKFKKGTYRVRARFLDSTHPTAKYTSRKTITVY